MKYRFFCTHNSIETELFPYNFINDKFVYEKTEGEIFFRLKLSGKLIFGNDIGKPDFTYFKTIEDGVDRCLEISIRIERSCDKGLTYSVYWNGYFAVNDGKFDLDNCIYEIEPKIDDAYRCILEASDKEINILNIPTTISTTTDFVMDYEFAVCYPVNDISECPLPGGGTWLEFFEFVVPGHTNENIVVYYREIVKTLCVGGLPQSPPGTWTLVANDCALSGISTYARVPTSPISPVVTQISGPGPVAANQVILSPYIAGVYVGWVWTRPVGTTTYDRNRTLEDILNYLIDQIGCDITGVVSDFFEINPDGTAPGYVAGKNYVTGDTNKVDHLSLAQKSDIISPTSTEKAKKGMLTWDDLAVMFREVFNVFWFIEGATLRLEHIKYFNYIVGFDLTTIAYSKYIAGTRKYEYLKLKMPKYERYKWMEALNLDFVGAEIRYDSICVNQNEKENILEHLAGDFTTDISFINSSPSDISKEGFVILSNALISGSYSVIKEVGQISGLTMPNNHLSWANLHYNYHRYNRVLLSGNMNTVATNFLTSIRIKKQVAVTFPLCCNPFDPEKLITTGLGNGQVDKAEISVEDNFITVELLL